MKIAMPVDDKSMESSVCISFGRTPCFLIYDINSKESIFVDNTAVTSPGGAGIKAAQIVVDNKVDALITPRCGRNAAEVIYGDNIKIYKSIDDSIMSNIDDFKDDKLSLLEEIHEGFHGHGNK